MEFLENAREIDVEGRKIPVISPEDLVTAKILAGRLKDMEDAESVVAEQLDRLDLGRIRHWLEVLEQSLDRRDLLPELERMVDRASRHR
jgi:predicted nucleotidyltransferase